MIGGRKHTEAFLELTPCCLMPPRWEVALGIERRNHRYLSTCPTICFTFYSFMVGSISYLQHTCRETSTMPRMCPDHYALPTSGRPRCSARRGTERSCIPASSLLAKRLGEEGRPR